ncbi:SurA N-terminal domain-containing protein [Desulfococcaceae bacterium OttesenSCG-928-F15]|nr:SurA N-terminal domain-containing protein [Desulfococcaceae bacterium OttesenSCG-928-F15]
MMSRMKAQASSLMVKIILGLIVLVFVFWGTGSYRAGQLNRVALVNGTGVSLDLFRVEYENIVQELRGQFGGTLPDGALEMFNVRERALWRTIDRELLHQEAERLKLRVTDEEIANLIFKSPNFQKDGRFDRTLYENFLKDQRTSAPVFESRQREMMLINKLYTLTMGGVQVSSDEALDAYLYQNLRLGVEAALFQPSHFTPAEPGEEAVLAYYGTNKEKYKIEERIRVAYVRFSPEDFLGKIPELTEEELGNAYENQKARFEEPERVEASHILLTLAPNAPAADVEEAKTKLLGVRKQALEGSDFASLAREFSQCPSAAEGGNLGVFTREEMIKPFSDAAFAMKEGEISEPVRTPYGWHLIRISRHFPAGVRTFDEVRGELLVELKDEKAASMAYDVADDAYEAVLKGADLKEISRDWNVGVQETAFFGSGGPTEIRNSHVFAERAFSLADGEVSELLEIAGSVYLVSPMEREPARIPELDEIRETVLLDMRKAEADSMAKTEAEVTLAKLKANEDLPTGTLTKTGLFGRSGEIPGLGNYPALTRAAFSLPKTENLPAAPVVLPDGYAVFKVVERIYPDEKDFGAVRERIEDQLRVEKQSRMRNQWMLSLREKAKIEIQPGFQGTQENSGE